MTAQKAVIDNFHLFAALEFEVEKEAATMSFE
jgi:hypothetical protein